ncbi:hypothetical protein [Effusibacillus lacus]|uniref:hypothetical protein n=1 Tax=Effusibacillus lacus TaxID=1348429 RepID=UPI001A9D50DF|nr:hypothetical protein [Effusibacillus lacus]
MNSMWKLAAGAVAAGVIAAGSLVCSSFAACRVDTVLPPHPKRYSPNHRKRHPCNLPQPEQQSQ